jgi:hypothetical protein
MGKPELHDAIELFSDRKWRLNNLYKIQDKHGRVVTFKLNEAQSKLLDDLHTLNIILKARQMGFSTFILILALDCCLFNSHFDAGLIADTLPNAKGLLSRIKFAYDKLDTEIKKVVNVKTMNATTVEFSNSSSIEVGVSLRSSTKNFLHISEYGKICAKSPDKAAEIKSGALNTMAKGQLGFIESTAEGRGGDFYDKTNNSRAAKDSNRELTQMEWKFHFFPWFEDSEYTTSELVNLTADEEKYFTDLFDEYGIQLSAGQQAWYALKAREQGDAMFKEYPSTPDEAFLAARDGAYFAKQLTALRQRSKIGKFEFETRSPVNTFWDLGLNDSTSIWLHQVIAGKHRFVGFYENSGEGLAHYLSWLDKWQVRHDAVWGEHYGPHDMDHRQNSSDGFVTTRKDIAQGLGYSFRIVNRTLDKQTSIQKVRTILPECEFDEGACDAGIKHLESYSKEWDEKYSVWKNQPRHDEHSHCADAFMTFADGFEIPTQPKKRNRPKAAQGAWMG